jgi:hydroxymethylbilane synthase
MMKKNLRLGTRHSKLALWQANWVADALRRRYPEIAVELVKITTRGDKSLEVLIPEIGGKGFFTEELDHGLLRGEIDLAVHSLKDLPTQLPHGLMLAAVCNRKWVHDVLIGREAWTLDSLPYNANVGTCSMRRTAQIKHRRPDLNILPLRGNVPTRIQKLRSGEYDAIVLAEAGVRRLGLENEIAQVLLTEIILPAPAQGALGIEILASNHAVHELIAALDEPQTRATTTCERAVLHELGAGCQVPVAALAECEDGRLHCRGLIAGLDGTRLVRDSVSGSMTEAEKLGRKLAQQLLRNGGAEILKEIKSESFLIATE